MAKAELKLLGTKLSPFSFRVQWALKLKGIEYEFIEEDLYNKSQLLLASNPIHKKIPILIHNDRPMPESLIILEYIDETWKRNPIFPKDPYERAQARFWAKFAEDKFLAEIATAFASAGETQVKAVEAAIEALEALEEQIKGKKFFGGESIGFLDIVVGWIAYWLEFVEESGCFKVLNSTTFPSFDLWMKNFLEVPIIKENLPPRDVLQSFFHELRQVKVASIGIRK